MRRHLLIAIVGSALLAAGCGDDNTAEEVRTQAEEAVRQAEESADDLVRETQSVADDVTRSARELAEDPDADVDASLEESERQARELADRAERGLPDDEAEVRSAITEANEQLADAATSLREAEAGEDARAAATRVAEEDLPRVADRLSAAARGAGDRAASGEAEERVNELREEIEKLERDLPDIGR